MVFVSFFQPSKTENYKIKQKYPIIKCHSFYFPVLKSTLFDLLWFHDVLLLLIFLSFHYWLNKFWTTKLKDSNGIFGIFNEFHLWLLIYHSLWKVFLSSLIFFTNKSLNWVKLIFFNDWKLLMNPFAICMCMIILLLIFGIILKLFLLVN